MEIDKELAEVSNTYTIHLIANNEKYNPTNISIDQI